MIAKMAFFLVVGEIYARLERQIRAGGFPLSWSASLAAAGTVVSVGIAWGVVAAWEAWS